MTKLKVQVESYVQVNLFTIGRACSLKLYLFDFHKEEITNGS